MNHHQPDLPVSCILRTTTARDGMIKPSVITAKTTATRPPRAVESEVIDAVTTRLGMKSTSHENSAHHQYSEGLALPVKSPYF